MENSSSLGHREIDPSTVVLVAESAASFAEKLLNLMALTQSPVTFKKISNTLLMLCS